LNFLFWTFVSYAWLGKVSVVAFDYFLAIVTQIYSIFTLSLVFVGTGLWLPIALDVFHLT